MADYSELKVIKVCKKGMQRQKNPIKFCYAFPVCLTMGMDQNFENQEGSFLLFVFELSFFRPVEEFFQVIHFVVPEGMVGFEPVCHFFEFVELSVTISFSSLLFDGNQSAFCEYADMFGDGRPAHVKMFCNAVKRQVLPAE